MCKVKDLISSDPGLDRNNLNMDQSIMCLVQIIKSKQTRSLGLRLMQRSQTHLQAIHHIFLCCNTTTNIPKHLTVSGSLRVLDPIYCERLANGVVTDSNVSLHSDVESSQRGFCIIATSRGALRLSSFRCCLHSDPTRGIATLIAIRDPAHAPRPSHLSAGFQREPGSCWPI